MKTSHQQQAILTNRKHQARKPKGLSRLFFRKSRNPNRENPKEKKKRKIKNTAMAEFRSLRKAKE
jgi:hypothetical protein